MAVKEKKKAEQSAAKPEKEQAQKAVKEPVKEPCQAGQHAKQNPKPSTFSMAIFFAFVAAMAGVLQYVDRPPTAAGVTDSATAAELTWKDRIPKTVLTKPLQQGMMTAEMLSEYDDTDPSKPIYLALMGNIYDVTKGKDYYGKDGGYHGFAGRDGSRAYITGEFNDTGLIPDLTGFTPGQYEGVKHWNDFYQKEDKYPFVAKLIGHFYDEDGNPTEALKKFDTMVQEREDEIANEKAFEKQYPPCNSRWAQQTGGEVWCSTKSGGIDRPWEGVPRKYVTKRGTKEERKKCVCVSPDKIATVDKEMFEEYPNCDPSAVRCST